MVRRLKQQRANCKADIDRDMKELANIEGEEARILERSNPLKEKLKEEREDRDRINAQINQIQATFSGVGLPPSPYFYTAHHFGYICGLNLRPIFSMVGHAVPPSSPLLDYLWSRCRDADLLFSQHTRTRVVCMKVISTTKSRVKTNMMADAGLRKTTATSQLRADRGFDGGKGSTLSTRRKSSRK
jgi:hypothetical protein